ncbi:hypothetical protein GGX14DRAFT_578278 [Mycena pura]|uniref:DUF659 domain-containing protein n=1 Tax=Mycena pura TaxID=153505 RepID=A0AAD6XY57_9AGAR|nr:hypothetical protein GGX14DRAFT_578278 [Mycena pura]
MVAYLEELNRLERYVKALPVSLPASELDIGQLEPSAAEVDDYGSTICALNRRLEISFGSRAMGPLELKFRGEYLIAVVTILRRVITGTEGENIIMIKWVDDLTNAAKAAIEKSGGALPRPTKSTARQQLLSVDKANEERREKAKKLTEQGDVGLPLEQLEDVTVPEKAGPGRGKKPNALLDSLVIKCRVIQSSDAQNHLDVEAQDDSDLEAQDNPDVKKITLGGYTSMPPTSASSSSAISSDGTAAKLKKQSDFFVAFEKKGVEKKQAALEQRQTRSNLLALNFICDTGIAVATVDNLTFRALLGHLDARHGLHVASTFSNNHIPFEAARITELTYDHLRTKDFLSLTFDGGNIRRPQACETVHVTETSSRGRIAHFVHGDESSGVSHTGEHLSNILDVVIIEIGPEHCGSICSDSTGNTTVARVNTNRKYPWIVILRDPCHHLANTVKDICSLNYFVKVIANFKGGIRYFSKSAYASTHLRAVRVTRDINRGLGKSGKTRFGTVYWSGYSFERCLPAIRELIQSNVVDARKESSPLYFLRSLTDSTRFTVELAQLNRVLEPIARAIKCLEGLDVTLADNSEGYPHELMADIRAIVNSRFAEMMEDDLGQVYFAHFYLDPDNINSPLLRRNQLNALADDVDAPMDDVSEPSRSDQDLHDSIPAYEKVGLCISRLLHGEFKRAAKYKLDIPEFRSYAKGVQVSKAVYRVEKIFSDPLDPPLPCTCLIG